MASKPLIFNGIDAETGEPSLPALSRRQLGRMIHARPGAVEEKRSQIVVRSEPMPWVDVEDLETTGWGIVFAADASDSIHEALARLRCLRSRQAAPYYQEFRGDKGVRAGEQALNWLARQGAGPGPADPATVPYYLLLVGSPEEIPFAFQFELSLQYAVGRLHFATLEAYENYAKNVIESEQLEALRQPKAAFFGVCNNDDPATRFTFDYLMKPLHERLQDGALKKSGGRGKAAATTWRLRSFFAQDATKARLANLLSEDPPALLFTTSHGLGPAKNQQIFPGQVGALLCQDWPGPAVWRQQVPRRPIPAEHCFAAEDVAEGADLRGLIAFMFACFSVGMPSRDSFAHEKDGEPKTLAPRPILAGLPRRLLGKKRGALAVIGHVDRARGFSFIWPGAGAQSKTFEAVLRQLMSGLPVGASARYLSERWATISAAIHHKNYNAPDGGEIDLIDLADMWTASIDARSYLILGDPAVRLRV